MKPLKEIEFQWREPRRPGKESWIWPVIRCFVWIGVPVAMTCILFCLIMEVAR